MNSDTVDANDKMYVLGFRAAQNKVLVDILNNLGYDNNDANFATLVLEREAAIASLRHACEEFGDNDWPNDLSLSDIIDKHLVDCLMEYYVGNDPTQPS